MPKSQFNQKLNSRLRRLIHFRPHGIRWRSFENYIKRLSLISRAGFTSSAALFIISLLIIFPIYYKAQLAEATGNTSDTTLSITSDGLTAGVDLLVTSDSGTFASSASPMSFSVTTNNVTGYMLSISAKTGTDLTNSTAGTSFTSLSTANGIDATTFDTTTYNNQWGFKPNYYKSTANSDKFYPSPTKSGVTLNKTDSANASGSSDTYTIAIGARATYSQPAGTYSNTYTLNAVGNYPTYSITYNANTTDSTLANMPSPNPQVPDSDDIVGSTVTLSSATPTRMGYKFLGWCSVNNSADPTTCSGTTYQPGASYALYTTSANSVTLYAMWTELTAMQNLDANICTTAATEVYDNRDGIIYNIQRLADGKCWLLDNLALDTSTASLTIENTNMKSGTSAAATVVSSNFNSYTTARINIASKDAEVRSAQSADTKYKVGVYYNYCAASAGTYCHGIGEGAGNSVYDICPAGWRMPTGGSSGEYQSLYAAYNNSSAEYSTALRLPLSGYFAGNSTSVTGESGVFWSSTYNDADSMSLLFANTTGANAAWYGYRYSGNPVRCIMQNELERAGINYLQDFASITGDQMSAILSSMPTGEVYTLEDSRDNQSYSIAKLADGNIWLLDNLRLGAATLVQALSISNTNMSASVSFTIPNSSSTGFNGASSDDYTTPKINTEYSDTEITYDALGFTAKYGVYYNYCAASAGTYCYSGGNGAGDAKHDICPAGWRMPTGGTNGEYRALYQISQYNSPQAYQSALHLPLSGYFHASTTVDQGVQGAFWASTYNGANTMSILFTGASSINSAWYSNRYAGDSIRCIMKSDTEKELGIRYMQDFNSDDQPTIMAKMEENKQYQLIDNRDGKKYYIAKVQTDVSAPGGVTEESGKYYQVWMTQNLDLCIGCTGTATLTSENTDINPSSTQSIYSTSDSSTGYSTSNGITTWTPASTATTSSYTISGTTVSPAFDTSSTGYNVPYSAEGGDYYVITSGSTDNDTVTDNCTAGDTVCPHYHRGNYYNWSAAAASNNTSSLTTNYTKADNSICPAGWMLPYGLTASAGYSDFNYMLKQQGIAANLVGVNTDATWAVNGFVKIRKGPLYFIRTGVVYGSSLDYSSTQGGYWSSTIYDSDSAYGLIFSSDVAYPAGTNYRSYGRSLRCLARTPTAEITFTIGSSSAYGSGAKEYIATSNMTWAEWASSSYSSGSKIEISADNRVVNTCYQSIIQDENLNEVNPSDRIISGAKYTYQGSGYCIL